MDERFGQKYISLEDRHWWHVSRRDMILKLVAGLPREARILDIGCSGGALMAALAVQGFKNVIGIDINTEAVGRCGRRGLSRSVVMDAQTLGFGDERFDLVISSDVLEHMPDPGRALEAWRRVLKAGGRLIVFVPAYPFLWSAHDVVNHHYKRYDRRDLTAVLRQTGFQVSRCSGWNLALFIPAAALAFFRGKTPGVQRSAGGGFLHAAPWGVNVLLTGLLCAENFLLRRRDAPAGISLFVVAHK